MESKEKPEELEIRINFKHTEPQNLEYVREKLDVAVWKLATGIEGIKARVGDAFIEIAILQETDFPAEFRDQRRQINLDLTRGKMQFESQVKDGQIVKIPIGSLYSTLRYMRKNKAQRIAQQIYDLKENLEDYAETKCRSHIRK